MDRALLPRMESGYLLVALAGIASFMLLLSHLPFQDYPNHLRVLELAASIDSSHPYLENPKQWIFAYRLHAWLIWMANPLLSVSGGLRLFTVAAAIAFPLSLMWLARVRESDPVWTGVLALPLVFSWPLKMGFLPFVFALPFAIAMLIAAGSACQRPRPGGYMALLLASLAAYCGHPMAFAWGAIGVGICWATVDWRRWRSAVSLNLSMLPILLIALWDWRQGAFSRVPGTESVALPYPFAMNPPDRAASMLLTRGYGLTGVDELQLVLPLVFVCLAGMVAAFRSGKVQWTGATRSLAWLTLFGAACVFVIPESGSNVFFAASRFAVLFVGLASVVAAQGLVGRKRWTRIGVLMAVSLAIAMNVSELQQRADHVQRLVGDAPARTGGRFLTARVAGCRRPHSVWGNYQSDWHLWAFGLSDAGVTPYLFAFAGYHPLHYRPGVLNADLRAPDQHVNSSDPYGRAGCRRSNIMRVAGALAWGGYDGVIVTGDPDIVRRVVSQAGGTVQRELAPGLLVATSAQRDPTRLEVNLGSFAGAAHLRDNWSYIEYDGRWLRWAIGEESTLQIALQPTGADYELKLNAHPNLRTPRTLGVIFNGQSLGNVRLEPAWRTYRFRVSASLLERSNTILLQHAASAPNLESNARHRSVAFAYLSLAPEELLAPGDDH